MSVQQGLNDPSRTARCLERIQGFRLLDDEFMSKVFEDTECAGLLLQIILNREDLPIYHIDRIINETNQLFNDAAHIVYVNAKITDNTTALGRLMHDFGCADHKDMNYPVLADRVQHFKEEEKGAHTMSKIVEELCDEFVKEDREETARALIANGKLSQEEIATITHLSIEEIKSLATAI